MKINYIIIKKELNVKQIKQKQSIKEGLLLEIGKTRFYKLVILWILDGMINL